MPHTWGGLRPIACTAALLGLGSTYAHAAEPVLPEQTVQERAEALDPAATPYATEVVDRATIERKQILDIRDATSDMVNVEVPRAPRRGAGISGTTGREGNTGFEIRGLGGNRVQMLVDGIPQPEADSFMNSHSFGRDYVDPLMLSGIEVHKGASTVGVPSGGVAGMVQMRTLSPGDLLGADKLFAGRALLGWRSENRGWNTGAAVAGKASEQVQWLLAAHGERSHATETMGHIGGTGLQRTKANPEDNHRYSLLGKLVLRPDGRQRHVFTAELRDKDGHVTNLHDFDNGTTRSHEDDIDSQRKRLSWQGEWQLDAPAADKLKAYAAWQDSSSSQRLNIDTSNRGQRLRHHRYNEQLLQLGLQAHKRIGTHGLHYGADVYRMKNDSQSLSTDSGVTTAVPKGPDTRTTQWGLFVEDHWDLGPWMLKPGLRYTSVDIDADASSIDMGQSGAQPVSKRFSAWLPQMGVQWQPLDDLQLFASYVRGFRAPTSGELNNFFGNVTPYYGYYILPNPDLKAETSNNFELGLRDAHGPLQWEVTGFYARYRNFIERYADAGSQGTFPVISLMRSRNQSKATIKGLELRGRAELGHSWGGQWVARAAYGYAKGTGENGQGLESISPQHLKLHIGQQAARWQWELGMTHTAAKQRKDMPSDSRVLFLPPSHTVLDLDAQWQLRKHLRLNVGLHNLTDRKYWKWSDVRDVTATAEHAAIDAYSQPGRNLRISLVAEF